MGVPDFWRMEWLSCTKNKSAKNFFASFSFFQKIKKNLYTLYSLKKARLELLWKVKNIHLNSYYKKKKKQKNPCY